MWNLPISELFMVGKKTLNKLDKLGIKTIGDLAKKDERFIIKHFGKDGFMIWSYANGNSNEEVNYKESRPKGIGNSVTLPYDMASIEQLTPVLVRLSEQVSYRLRKENMIASVVNVQLKNNKFEVYQSTNLQGVTVRNLKYILIKKNYRIEQILQKRLLKLQKNF